jgi:hypothetical protein
VGRLQVQNLGVVPNMEPGIFAWATYGVGIPDGLRPCAVGDPDGRPGGRPLTASFGPLIRFMREAASARGFGLCLPTPLLNLVRSNGRPRGSRGGSEKPERICLMSLMP